jgi:chromosome partitioning protein
MLIALANPKGGVGKTTIAVHVAILAHEHGRRTAFIDADAQESSTRWLRGMGEPFGPAHRFRNPDDLIGRIDAIVEEAELTIADGPAGLSEITRVLIMAADLVLMPCGPSALDLYALKDALRVLRHAQKIRKGPPKGCLIPNKLQANYRLSRELLEAAEGLGIPSLDGLRLRQAYADAAGQGTVVWRLKADDAAREFQRLYDQIHEHENS